MTYLRRIGALDALDGPQECVFDFMDLASGERWRLRPNAGRLPWWIFSSDRRVPGTSASDYLGGIGLLTANARKTVTQALTPRGALWDRLWKPVLVSALNTQLDEASAQLAAAIVRESPRRWRSRGASARAQARPGSAFVDPALAHLAAHGAEIRYGDRLRAIYFDDAGRMNSTSANARSRWRPRDTVILATPAWIAAEIARPRRRPSTAPFSTRIMQLRRRNGHAASDRRRGRPHGMAVRLSRQVVGDHQRRRCAD